MMRIHPTVVLLLCAAAVLAMVHIVAIELFLYWNYIWLDVPMHMLGGAIAALALFAGKELRLPIRQWMLRLPFVLSFVFAIGVLWELFEVAAGVYMADNYAFDTSLDLLMDLVGGTVGYFVGSRMRGL